MNYAPRASRPVAVPASATRYELRSRAHVAADTECSIW